MATRRKHVDFSQTGEEVDVLAKQREEIASQAAVGNSVTIPPKQRIFKLVDTKRGNMPLVMTGIIDVRNPEGKTERVRILKGVSEVWQSKQEKLPPEYIRANRRDFTFHNKVLFVDTNDSTGIWLMENHPCNVGGKNYDPDRKHRFFEWNPQAQAEAENQTLMKEIEAVIKAQEMPEEKMRKHALYLGISFQDAVGMPKIPEAIRIDYKLYARKDPIGFMASMDSKDVEISYLVKKAIQDAKIDLGRQPNQAFWADGGVICRIPTNRRQVDYLVELASTNSEEGKQFLEQLQTKIVA